MLWIDSVTFEATSATTLTGSSSGSSSGSNPTLPSLGSSSSTFPKGAIAGIAAGAFLLALVCFRYVRRNCNPTPYRETFVPGPPQPLPPVTVPPPPWQPPNTGRFANPGYPPSPPSDPEAGGRAQWDGSNPSYPRPSGGDSRRTQWDGSNSTSNANRPLSPPAAPRVPLDGADPNANADRTRRTSRAQWDGSNSESNSNILWDGATPNATSTYDPSTPGQSYFTYSEKEKLVGLQWGESGSDNLMPDSIPTLLLNAGGGIHPNPIPAAHEATRADGLDSTHGRVQRPFENPDPTSGSMARAPTPRNHAQEDGRDDDGEAADEPPNNRDHTGQASGLPPAYED